VLDARLLGGKAVNLALMEAMGAPIPPAFVLTTEAFRNGLDGPLWKETLRWMRWLEHRTGRTFGEDLLVSVRSGAPVSMPGMLDTVLNVGLTPDGRGDQGFLSSCRRTLEASFRDGLGVALPSDPHEQLRHAIAGVFGSWQNGRARLYRRIRGIEERLGTAVTVQAMVFGNRGDRSGTGVLLTRDTTTGIPEPSGEFAFGSQGEALVSGRLTPEPLDAMFERLPEAGEELLHWGRLLERQLGDVQDVEFTVEEGELYLLQARLAKRTPFAACRIAVDMAREGMIDRQEAVTRTASIDLEKLVLRRADPEGTDPLCVGRGAVLGAAHGPVATSSISALRHAARGRRPVLVRDTTSPDDLPGIRVAAAVATRRGGLTSHAALVARELSLPAVVGCGNLPALERGEIVTVDGTCGRIYRGERRVVEERPEFVGQLRSWRGDG
jgi:pyruvate,orthophosphate dikinase